MIDVEEIHRCYIEAFGDYDFVKWMLSHNSNFDNYSPMSLVLGGQGSKIVDFLKDELKKESISGTS